MKIKAPKPLKTLRERHKKMQEQDKMYGTATLGTRGQVVIPVEARNDLGLKSGDQLLVMGKFGKVLGLMKTDQLTSFVDMIMDNFSGSEIENEVKSELEKNFGSLINTIKK